VRGRDPHPTESDELMADTLEPPRFEDIRPSVAVPDRPWVMPAVVVGALALGAGVFMTLAEGREQAAASMVQATPGAPPVIDSRTLPPLPDLHTTPVGDYAEPPAPQIQLPIVAGPAALLPQAGGAGAPPPGPTPEQQAALAALEARRKSPSLVFDAGAPDAGAMPLTPGGAVALRPDQVAGALGMAMAPGTQGAAGTPREGLNADERFAARVAPAPGTAETPVRATRMSDTTNTVIEGTVVPGVLETAINSDLPGFVRATVTRDIRGFDNRRVLIPRGSRLIGQYRSGVALGQSRAFVIWTRLVTPDGVSVPLGAPGTDELGRGGLEGDVDRKFLQRFGGAILLSLISAGANVLQDEADTQVVIASTRAGQDAAAVALQNEANLSPTIRVDPGAQLRIFVTRDIDFSRVVGP